MTGAHAGRDAQEIDALVTDRYLEALLSAHARGADRDPAPSEPAPPIRLAAERLARDLPRLHPSFRFEEALAARLAEVAARMGLPAAAGAEGMIVPLPGRPRAVPPDEDHGAGGGSEAETPGAEAPGARAGAGDPRSGIGRPLLIGGALTSAALTIGGAAYVAWRLNRPPASAMVRAARAVARTRPA